MHSYGWRKGELLKMPVGHLDLVARTMRLCDTKNASGRIVVMTPKCLSFSLPAALASAIRKIANAERRTTIAKLTRCPALGRMAREPGGLSSRLFGDGIGTRRMKL